MSVLDIRKLTVSVESKTVLCEFSLIIPSGEVHALMGPNGAGKSSLANTIAGHPHYKIESGDILFDGKSVIGLSPDERARLGIFLSFQHPAELSGVSVANFIRAAIQARSDGHISATEFYKQLYECMDLLHMDRSFTSRSMNVGFSGGEKKRFEILQMLMLRPTCILLDEIDSGLDIDALKIVAEGFNSLRGGGISALVITHYGRLLRHIVPDVVHIIENGRITRSGDLELVDSLEEGGYQNVKT
ncbi:MAG: Fe-S cluster assembly ATPase SufC [Puniceicoccales bacterium]|jgi:Fe-S cluster assembly ATP-binding protein|nr:Fe-S cluster assembly ATPase SufC [Puniceicoccales bacterium]